MIVEFEQIRYHQDEYEKYERMGLENGFKGDFSSKVIIDINKVEDFNENPQKKNGVVKPCTQIILDDGRSLTICISYNLFKSLWLFVNTPKIFSKEQALNLIKNTYDNCK